MEGSATTSVDVAQVVAAVAGIVIAALVAVMPFARRPRLSVSEDPERVHSRVEATSVGQLPHVRLLVANQKRRRAAQGTRVLVEWYQARNGERVSLSHPSLGWPSAPESEESASVVVFAGGHRAVSLARLIRVLVEDDGGIRRPDTYTQTIGATGPGPRRFPHLDDVPPRYEETACWYLYLAELDVNDDRDKLPPVENGYTIRLLVGADDGAARAFEVDLSWVGDPRLSAEEVLASALDHLAVREVR
jgi:hypothetical protein